MSFSSLKIKETICNVLENSLNIKTPTEIQKKVIKRIKKTKGDVSIKAETGSGKTLSFLIPIINSILDYDDKDNKKKRESGTHALIICPTRELAIQTHLLCQSILSKIKPHWMTSCLLLGSNSFSKDREENCSKTRTKEKTTLRKGQTIVVATPGRLLDHLENTKSFVISSIKWIVFDEADRLIDLGFGKKTKEIISKTFEKTNERPRLIICSATLKVESDYFAEIPLNDLDVISCSYVLDKTKTVPEKLKQYSVICPEKERLSFLLSFLSLFLDEQIQIFIRNKDKKMIVFFSSCDSVDFHFSIWMKYKEGFLTKKSFKEEQFSLQNVVPKSVKKSSAFKLHGGIDQSIRTKTYSDFLNTDCSVLFCTDVAARGINVPEVSCVLQYDAPIAKEEYLHRIGRTARAGNSGASLIVLMSGEKGYLSFLEKEGLIVKLLPLELLTGGFDKRKKENFPDKLSDLISNDPVLQKLGQKGILSFVRSYSTHKPAMKCFFHKRRLHLGGLATSFGLNVGVKEAQESEIKNKRIR